MPSLQHTPLGTRASLALCYIALMVDGFDLVTNGLIAPLIAPQFGMGAGDLGLLFGLTSMGMLIGAIVGGSLGDRYGPKWGLVQALVVFGTASLLSALATSGGVLIAMRVCTGIGIGAALPNVLSYVTAVISPDRSAGIGTVMASAVPIGGGMAGLLIFLMPTSLTWQGIVIIGGLLPLVIALPLGVFLPNACARSQGGGERPSMAHLLAPSRSFVTSLLWLCSFLMMMVFYVYVNWLPTFFGYMGLPKAEAGLVMLAFTYAGAFSAILFGLLLRKRSRLTALSVVGFGGTALGAIGLQWAGPEIASIAVAAIFASIFSSGAQCLLFGLSPTLYPAELRGAGTGAAIAAGRLGAIVGPMGAGFVLAAGGTHDMVLMLIVPVVLGALIATLAVIKAASKIAGAIKPGVETPQPTD